MKSKTILEDIILHYFEALRRHKISFAIVGNYENLPKSTENDVDLWVDNPNFAKKLLDKIAKQQDVILYLCNQTANGSNNYFYKITGKEQYEIIKIDLMRETAFNSFMPIVNKKQIENNLTIYNNLPVVNRQLESCMHLLYPLLHFKKIKSKYKLKLHEISLDKKFQKELSTIIGTYNCKIIVSHLQNKDWESIENMEPVLKKCILKNFLWDLRHFERFLIFFYHVKSIIFRLVRRNGIFIAFTGIDGAGKTSIIYNIETMSDKYFLKGKTQNFYWRPFLLPRIAKIFGGSTDENEVYNRNSGRREVSKSFLVKFVSHFKYMYYVIDFIIGKAKYLNNLKRGGLVLFDRYHLDNVIYPERFGFRLSKKLLNIFDNFVIPKPDLIFYLTADTKILYQRKKEISEAEINKQKFQYTNLINEKKNVRIIDTGNKLEICTNKIIYEVLKFMSKKYD